MRFVVISIAAVVLAAAASVLLVPLSPSVRAAGPEITYMFPEDGDVLAETPSVIQMCFAEPVNNRDLDKGGDFKFNLTPPDHTGVGMRIVFQPDGYGFAIYPNISDKPTEGEWTLTYRVTDDDTPDAIEGKITYTVKAGGKPVVKPTPPACAGNNTPGPTLVPTGGTPSASGTPTPSSDTGGSGDGPDILKLALLTIAAAGGAAVIALIGYALRGKFGFWLHRPPPRDGGDGPGDH